MGVEDVHVRCAVCVLESRGHTSEMFCVDQVSHSYNQLHEHSDVYCRLNKESQRVEILLFAPLPQRYQLLPWRRT